METTFSNCKTESLSLPTFYSQDATDLSLSNHLQSPPSHDSSMKNGKIDERIDFYNNFNHQDFFCKDEDVNNPAREGCLHSSPPPKFSQYNFQTSPASSKGG